MIDAGISVIYQELNLVPYLSVAENIFLGREPRRPWPHRLEGHAQGGGEAPVPFQPLPDPRAKIQSIGPAYQQVVEIAKALSLKAGIIVMDEPPPLSREAKWTGCSRSSAT